MDIPLSDDSHKTQWSSIFDTTSRLGPVFSPSETEFSRVTSQWRFRVHGGYLENSISNPTATFSYLIHPFEVHTELFNLECMHKSPFLVRK